MTTWIKTMTGRCLYGLLALPIGLAALFGVARRTQATLARRLLGVPAHRGTLRFSLVSLPANLLTFVLLAPAWAVFVCRGFLYPVFGAGDLENSWGGPTLIGAWITHWIIGPPMLVALTLLLWPVGTLQTRLAREHLV